jgi:hypothetical protein
MLWQHTQPSPLTQATRWSRWPWSIGMEYPPFYHTVGALWRRDLFSLGGITYCWHSLNSYARLSLQPAWMLSIDMATAKARTKTRFWSFTIAMRSTTGLASLGCQHKNYLRFDVSFLMMVPGLYRSVEGVYSYLADCTQIVSCRLCPYLADCAC